MGTVYLSLLDPGPQEICKINEIVLKKFGKINIVKLI